MKIKVFVNAVYLAALIAAAIPLRAQVEAVRGNYFPAELEFKELKAIQSERKVSDETALKNLRDGRFIAEVGFEKYWSRTYALTDGTPLTIEVVELKDPRAAYSLLTLFRTSDIAAGLPGEVHSESERELQFSQGNFWVRIQGAPPDLARRIALSVGNRVGHGEKGVPLLVSHFPKEGYDSSSLRYFLGRQSYDAYSQAGDGPLKFRSDMEVAQAKYKLDTGSGVMSLVSFPTSQLADDYLDSVTASEDFQAKNTTTKVYAKKAGPIVALLQGDFAPAAAEQILGSIQFTYAIKWIYDKNHHNSATLWGVPMGILGTVVRSLALTALLCGASLVAGIGFAVFRLTLRGYAPGNFLDRPERTEMIRLKIDEN